ncbi:MAG: DNA repair protein RecN [Peptoniphilaceae bacterium]
MLLELSIKNFAIIEDLRVEFGNGLNVLTGETGSGKSIIIDALSIVLGQRVSKDIIKKGKDYAYIEAIFTNYNKDLYTLFEENSIESGDLIVISKEIKLDRPSITKINGRTITKSVLSKISTKLIDIFAQHESISIMNLNNQKILIDSFGDDNHKKLLSELKDDMNVLSNLEKDYKNKSYGVKDRDRELDLLKYQINEIEDAELTDRDNLELEEEFNRANNMAEITDDLNIAKGLIKSSYNSASIEDLLDQVVSRLSNVLKYDSSIEDNYNEIIDIKFRLRDISFEIENRLSSFECDSQRLVELENRLNIVNNLKKKYGNTVDEIYNYLDSIKKRYSFLENFEEEMQRLSKKISELRSKALGLAEKISANRKIIAENLEFKLKKELRELNIKNGDFRVNFSAKPLGKDGIDNIEFMITTNLGEDFKSLSQIASGGEMSRIMLAFKSIIAKKDKIQTLVFDEIDTGISGITAQIVGDKIKEISKNTQVIAISHLPQIVSIADYHYVIEKIQDENKTVSNIRKLKIEDRVKELARLIGGIDITEAELKAAKEMLTKKENKHGKC